ncbi:MAG: polysaccharide biosynthesis/export family protein [Planctomycetales bacterium]|nr:polysaccharide biosynthesis/export family protein [Planctomycetales bacterium]
MNDTLQWIVALGWIRNTIGVSIATTAAMLLLRRETGLSPRVQRIVWALSLLPAWAMFPQVIELPIRSSPLPSPPQSIANAETWSNLATDWDSSAPDATPPRLIDGTERSLQIVWLSGIVCILANRATRYWKFVHRVPLGSPPKRADWQTEWRAVRAAFTTRRHVEMRIHRELGPWLCYIPFSYLLMIPESLWRELPSVSRRAILSHEMAHVARGDLWKNALIRLLALPQWFNPFAWIAVRRFETTAEWACDDLAANDALNGRIGYAQLLVDVALRLHTPSRAVVSLQGGDLSRRITRLISPPDKEISRMKPLLAPCLLAALAVPQFFEFRPVYAEDHETQGDASERDATVDQWRQSPYVIEPPDVLTIEVNWPDSPTSGAERTEAIVGPDGRIGLGRGKNLYVCGHTAVQASQSIADKLATSHHRPEVAVRVRSSNSKAVYIIERTAAQGIPPRGDEVIRIPCLRDSTLASVMQAADIPMHKFASATVLPPGASEQSATAQSFPLGDGVFDDPSKPEIPLIPGDRILLVAHTDDSDVKAPAPSDSAPATSTEIAPTPAERAVVEAAPLPNYYATVAPLLQSDSAREIQQIDFHIELIAMSAAEPPLLVLRSNASADEVAGRIETVCRNGKAKRLAAPRIVTTVARPAQIALDGGNRQNPLAVTLIAESVNESGGRFHICGTEGADENRASISQRTFIAWGDAFVGELARPGKGSGDQIIYLVVIPKRVP